MPKFLNEKGVAHLFLLFILLAGIVGGLVLIRNPKIFAPKAAPVLPDNPEVSLELELEKNAQSPFTDDPTPSSIAPDSQFRVDIYARSDTEEANLFSAKVKYSADSVDFVSIEKREGQSFVKNWVDASSDAGMVNLVGGYPNPGIKTDSKVGALLMGSIIFKSKGSGVIKIEVSDTSAIYSNATNINILTARKGVISTSIQSSQPTPTPTSSPSYSCKIIDVAGGIQGKNSSGETIYIVDSEGTIKLTAQVSPADAKIEWKEASRSNNLPVGHFETPNSLTTTYKVPKNTTGNNLEGVTIRADIPNPDTSKNPLASCPNVTIAVKSITQTAPSLGFNKAIKTSRGSNTHAASFPGWLVQGNSDGPSITNPKGPATIEMWIQLTDNLITSDDAYLIYKDGAFFSDHYRNTTVKEPVFYLQLQGLSDGGGKLTGYLRDTSKRTQATVTKNIPSLKAGDWHHIALVYDGTYVKLFLGGNQIDLATAYTGAVKESAGDGTSSLTIEGEKGNSLPITIDEIRISNIARYGRNGSAGNYYGNPPSDPFMPDNNTLLLWHLDGYEVNSARSYVLRDASFYGNHGALSANIVDSTIKGLVTINQTDKYNLIVKSIYPAEGQTIKTGTQISPSVTIENVGKARFQTGPRQTSYVDINFFKQNNTLLGTCRKGFFLDSALPITETEKWDVKIIGCPTLSEQGQYLIQAVVDPENTIDEGSESDNNYVAAVTAVGSSVSSTPNPTVSPNPVTYLLGEFLETFGLTSSDPKFNSKYDYNSDGRISVVDYSGLLSKFDPMSFQLRTGYSVDELISTYNKLSTDAGFNAKYDVNSDKAVNKADYVILNQDTVNGSGDGNNDGKVDFIDLSILLTDYNKNQGFRTGIDIKGDGVINAFDFALMKNLLIKAGLVKSN